ncbi:Glycerophosphocholine acyltransferase 1 [Taenia crassiceps]|uniref:Glycerophosphocholine acyltransferase 1 n=1 Tax=Taenia crassiceps TaxID=6207 RepID=A0ABR4QMJ3_9CEST
MAWSDDALDCEVSAQRCQKRSNNFIHFNPMTGGNPPTGHPLNSWGPQKEREGVPASRPTFLVLFGLANSTVYSAIILFRNSFVFHNYDKMTSCFIHIVPPLISFCVRWFPDKCSVFWWKHFVDTGGNTDVSVFNPMNDWIYLVVVPNAFFIAHTLIYFVVVHVIIRPDEKYNDNYRYLRKKYFSKVNFFKRIPKVVQTLIWVGLNIVVNFILNLIALLAWCTFLFHSIMIVAMVVAMSWYGASYYLDYFAYLALRKAIENNEVPAPADPKSPTEMENEKDEDEEVDESLRHNLETALEEESDSEIEV